MFLLLNGPPGVGKDTLFKQIGESTYLPNDFHRIAFADILKSAVHVFFGLDPNPAAFEAVKDTPLPEFGGLTPRQVYIDFAETYIRPKYGVDFFAKGAANKIKKHGLKHSLIVFTDLGFYEEGAYLRQEFPDVEMCVVQMYREGCSFKTDSRGYVSIPDRPLFKLHNNSSPRQMYTTLNKLVGGHKAQLEAKLDVPAFADPVEFSLS